MDSDARPNEPDWDGDRVAEFYSGEIAGWREVLGPEMHSTGEVMGVGRSFGEAYAKALMAAGMKLPTEGNVFLSLRDADKHRLVDIAGPLYSMGFSLLATGGTAEIFLARREGAEGFARPIARAPIGSKISGSPKSSRSAP